MTRASVQDVRKAGVSSLPDSHWKHLREVRRPQRSEKFDHLVVGPSGVYVITYLAPEGEMPAGHEEATRQAAGLAADAVRTLVPPRYRDKVTPVLCFVEERPVADLVDGVLVTSLLALERIVRSSPLLLSTSEVAGVFACVRSRVEPVPAVIGDVRRRVSLRAKLTAGAAVIASAAAGVVAFGAELGELTRIW